MERKVLRQLLRKFNKKCSGVFLHHKSYKESAHANLMTTLHAIIVPTGDFNSDVKRAKQGEREKSHLKDKGYYVISGALEEISHIRESQRYLIYKRLRRGDVKPSQIKIEGKSHDTLENVLYSLQLIKEKGGREVGIVSYPGHLDRFDDIIKYGQKKGWIDPSVRIHRIETDETNKDKLYEIFANILNKYKLKKLDQGKSPEQIRNESLVRNIKKIKNHVLGFYKT
ncbi:hypothetical protein CEE44_05360 [Candidatus Woesearchaeota archaeon B3_Woes]|nr:MAG: hypothetical protein CEE44_05360 [Candidatus Woesearchaeota archaeon B3_Woes]